MRTEKSSNKMVYVYCYKKIIKCDPIWENQAQRKLRWTVFSFQRILETFECITDHAFENIDNGRKWKRNALKIIFFKTFTMHFSEAVSHWKTFTRVQTTQQNTRTLNTSAKSINTHCPHRAATALKKYWTLEIYFIFYICKFPRRRCSQFSFHHVKLTLGHSPFVSVPFSTLTTKITNKQLTSDMQAFKALSQINVCGLSFLSALFPRIK